MKVKENLLNIINGSKSLPWGPSHGEYLQMVMLQELILLLMCLFIPARFLDGSNRFVTLKQNVFIQINCHMVTLLY